MATRMTTETRKHTPRMVAALLLSLMIALPGTAAWAAEFDEAQVLVEINATDGDAGFQGKIDGEPWNNVELKGPDGEKLFAFRLKGDAAEQGFTEFVWESAEPPFGQFALEEFLERFPEGEYTFKAKTIEGGRLRSTAELTHDLPAGPMITDPDEEEVVPTGVDLMVEWDAVTTTYATGDPQGEMTDPLDSAIVRHIVVAECENEDEEFEEVLEIAIHVAEDDMADSYFATIPGDFLRFSMLDDGGEYKIEVGAVEDSGNRTFVEVPICVGGCPDEDD